MDGTRKIELYDISQDLRESDNLADVKKGMVADLRKKLSGWQNEFLARITNHNPSYDPARTLEW